MRILCIILAVCILGVSSNPNQSCWAEEGDLDAEIDLILQYADPGHALVWVDLSVFNEKQIVPVPGQLLRFTDDKEVTVSRIDRPLFSHVEQLKHLGVNRIWFSLTSAMFHWAQRVIIPCQHPTAIAEYLGSQLNSLPKKLYIETREDAVILYFSVEKNPHVPRKPTEEWTGVKSLFPNVTKSHGYLSTNTSYFFLTPVNPFFERRAELKRQVKEMIPKIRLFYFKKLLPDGVYEIVVIFDSPETLKLATDIIAKQTSTFDEQLKLIQIESLESKLRIIATSQEGERLLDKAINTIRPGTGIQLP